MMTSGHSMGLIFFIVHSQLSTAESDIILSDKLLRKWSGSLHSKQKLLFFRGVIAGSQRRAQQDQNVTGASRSNVTGASQPKVISSLGLLEMPHQELTA